MSGLYDDISTELTAGQRRAGSKTLSWLRTFVFWGGLVAIPVNMAVFTLVAALSHLDRPVWFVGLGTVLLLGVLSVLARLKKQNELAFVLSGTLFFPAAMLGPMLILGALPR